jgi:hypothetical protein
MKYKTMFIDAPTVKNKGVFGMSMQEPNGDQLARDVDAAILEKVQNGYELAGAMPVTSSMIYSSTYPYSFTSGVLLIFKKTDE